MEIVCEPFYELPDGFPCKDCKDIYISTKLGHIACLDHLLCGNDRNEAGETCLHIAAKFQDLKMVKYLLEKKNVNIEICNKDGFSPFYIAVMKNKTDMVLYMISYIVDKYGSLDGDNLERPSEMILCFYMAGYRGNIKILEAMIRNGLFCKEISMAWISRVFPREVFPFIEKYRRGHMGQLRWSRENFKYFPFDLRKNIQHLVSAVHFSDYKRTVKPVISIVINNLVDQYFRDKTFYINGIKLPLKTNLQELYYNN